METTEELTLMQTLLPLAGIVFLIVLGVVALTQQFQKSLYKQQLEKQALMQQHQQELLVKAIEVQEAERKRIATDLHDQLGASLSMTRMQLRMLEPLVADADKPLKTGLPAIRELVEAAMTDTRKISYELMPVELLNSGLKNAIKGLADRARKASNADITVIVSEDISTDWTVSLGLFRIVSELLNNTLKHANASRIHISLSVTATAIELNFRDNGCGIAANQQHSGLGLASIEARAQALNGQLTWGNHPEGGFYAHLTTNPQQA